MAKPWAKSFYNSTKWIKCRNSYIAIRISIDGGICETCKNKLGLEVHHKITLTPENISNPLVTLNHKLLKYDCFDCHKREHRKTNKTPDLNFDDDGQLLPYPPM